MESLTVCDLVRREPQYRGPAHTPSRANHEPPKLAARPAPLYYPTSDDKRTINGLTVVAKLTSTQSVVPGTQRVFYYGAPLLINTNKTSMHQQTFRTNTATTERSVYAEKCSFCQETKELIYRCGLAATR